MAIDTEVLQKIPVFHLLDQDELKDLLAETEERSYMAGQTIFKEGQAGGEMHVILDGRVPHACLLELFTEAGPGTLIHR